MIRLGQGIIAAGVVSHAPARSGYHFPLRGLVIIGLGCAPVYPCIIHSTPDHFGAKRSQGSHRRTDGKRLHRHLSHAAALRTDREPREYLALSGPI